MTTVTATLWSIALFVATAIAVVAFGFRVPWSATTQDWISLIAFSVLAVWGFMRPPRTATPRTRAWLIGMFVVMALLSAVDLFRSTPQR
jgi:hypothetical protein